MFSLHHTTIMTHRLDVLSQKTILIYLKIFQSDLYASFKFSQFNDINALLLCLFIKWYLSGSSHFYDPVLGSGDSVVAQEKMFLNLPLNCHLTGKVTDSADSLATSPKLIYLFGKTTN